MLLLVITIAIGLEVYQVVAHLHCLSGRTLPESHRSTLGFGAAILGDAVAYLLSCWCLYAAGGPWALLLLPLAAHLFYWFLLVFVRSVYLRIHDYRLGTIYTDGSFCRSKRVAASLDASFHLLAVVLLAPLAPSAEGLCFAGAGLLAYLVAFAPMPRPRDQRA